MRILSKVVISKLLVSSLLNVSLDFFIFTHDSDRGVRGGGGGGYAFVSPDKKLNNFKTV